MSRTFRGKISVILAVLALSSPSAFSESKEAEFDKNLYMEDTLPYKEGELSVLINRNSGKVEYYWMDESDEWMAVGSEDKELQYLYENRNKIRKERQLRGMQQEMNALEADTMHEDMYGTHQ
jgi:hypothetical protein